MIRWKRLDIKINNVTTHTLVCKIWQFVLSCNLSFKFVATQVPHENIQLPGPSCSKGG